MSEDYETLSGTAGFILKPAEDWTVFLGYQRTLAARHADFYSSPLVGSSVHF